MLAGQAEKKTKFQADDQAEKSVSSYIGGGKNINIKKRIGITTLLGKTNDY